MTRKWIWTSIAISTMWIAVLFASVFGGDIVVESAGGDRVATPMGVLVAGFALLATIVAAAVGFRGETGTEARAKLEGRGAENRAPVAGTSR